MNANPASNVGDGTVQFGGDIAIEVIDEMTEDRRVADRVLSNLGGVQLDMV